MCLLHLQHISCQPKHISSTQWSNVTTILDSTGLDIFKRNKWTFVRECRWAEACWNDPSGEVKQSWLQIPTLTLTRCVCLVKSLYLGVFNCQNTLQESSRISQDSYNIRQKKQVQKNFLTTRCVVKWLQIQIAVDHPFNIHCCYYHRLQ